MFFDDLMKELTALDLQDDVTLLEWLHRLFAHAEKLEVTQLPNREKIADKINSISLSGGNQIVDQLKDIFVPKK